MRILILVVIACGIGISFGSWVTRKEFEDVDERFDLVSAPPTQRTPVEAVGRFVVNDVEKDFGMVKFESEHTHNFIIRNDGKEPLEIEKLKVSCSLCVKTDLDRAKIEPGEEYPLKVDIVARKVGSQFHETVELRTSDPDQPNVRLHLKAIIGSAARFDVDGLSMGDIPAVEGAEKRCRLYGYFSDEIEIVDPGFASPLKRDFIKFEIEKLNIDELDDVDEFVTAAYDVIVRVEPGIPVGPLRQTLTLVARVEGQDDMPLDLPIQGQVAGDLKFIGPSEFSAEYTYLSIGRVKQGDTRTYKMQVLVKGDHRDDVELSIETVDPSEALTATLGEPNKDAPGIVLHPLTITVREDAPSLNRLGTATAKPGQIVIKTTHPTAKEMVLLIRLAIE